PTHAAEPCLPATGARGLVVPHSREDGRAAPCAERRSYGGRTGGRGRAAGGARRAVAPRRAGRSPAARPRHHLRHGNGFAGFWGISPGRSVSWVTGPERPLLE